MSAYGSEQRFEPRLRSYLCMQRVATFVAELNGVPVGMVVGNDYGLLAYVSQMAVDPRVQRCGIGTRLMNCLIAWLDRRGFVGTELDATAAGAPLYRRYGFIEAGETVLYRGSPVAGSVRTVRPYVPADGAALFEADAAAFGADRSEVLRLLFRLPETEVFVIGNVGRPNGFAAAQVPADRLGPIVAPTPAAAGALLDAARTTFRGEHQVSAPAQNVASGNLLVARGYRVERCLAHMVRGTRPAAACDAIFARINLGQG